MTPLQRKVLRHLLELGASDIPSTCYRCDAPLGPELHNIAEPQRAAAQELLEALITDRIELRS